MNDDTALMPPPPPRRLKRHKILPPLNSERIVGAVQQQQQQQAAASEPTHLNLDSTMTSLFSHHQSSKDGGDIDGSAMMDTPFEREMKTIIYNIDGGVRPGAVSPEECSMKFVGVSASVHRDNSFAQEAANNSNFHIGSLTYNEIQHNDIACDESLAVNNRDNCMVGNDAIVNSNRQSSINLPFESSEKSKLHHKVSDKESARGSCQQGSMKRKHCDSPTLINVSFRDIIGHGQAKLRLDEALLPLALPSDLADSVLTGIRAAPASILLHGPPGCGKTKLAKAVAGEAQAAFLSVGPSDILSKFVGESEASIRGLFQEARRKAKKMESKCAVVFFDELDALGRSRVDEDSGKMSQAGGDNSSRRVLAELLIQMTNLNDSRDGENGSESEGEEYDGYCDDGESFSGRSTISTGTGIFDRIDDGIQEQHVTGTPSSSGKEGSTTYVPDQMQSKPRIIVIAATNRPEDCDPALLRRFAVRVLVGLPSRKDRKKIIQRLLLDVEHNITSSQLNELALATEGWSGSDLESMTREAVMAPVRECLRAAAITKRKASKVVQRRGGDSSQMQELKRVEDAQNATREALLNNFRTLRPVSAVDFEDGIAFFLGDQRDSSASGQFGSKNKQLHYDSSSSSDDDA